MGIGVEVAIGQALLSAGASFATASAIITALPTVALAAASIAATTVIAERQRAAFSGTFSQINNDRGLQQDTPDASPEHLMLLGYATLSGRRFFIRGGEDVRPYFWLGRLLAAHEIEGLDAIYINNRRIVIDPATGFATSPPFNDGVTQFLEVSFRNGSLDQEIDPILARDFPDLDDTFRQRGHASIVFKGHYGTGGSTAAQDDKHKELYGDGPFNPIVRAKAAKVRDPRNPNHDPDDVPLYPETWTWTENAVLNAIHGFCWKYPEMRSRWDWERTRDEADICDEFFRTKAGEALRRYTLSGALNSGDDPAQLIDAMLTSCGGQLLRNQGKLYIMPAQRKKPVGTLHKGNLRGTIRFFRDRADGDLINEVRPEFMSTERNFKMVPGPVIRNEVAIAEHGVERPEAARLPFTERHERSQLIATRIANEADLDEQFSGGVDISGMGWRAGQVITLDLSEWFPRLTDEWEILQRRFDDALGGYRLELRNYDPAIMNFNAQNDEQPFEVTEVAA